MKRYPKEIRDYIERNVRGKSTKQLVDLINAELGTSFTISKMRAYKKNYDLKSGIGAGSPAGLPTKLYPEEVREFIQDHYIGRGHKAMADLLNQTFGTNYTKDQLKAYYARFKLNSGLTGRFPKGSIPANKGKKGIHAPGCEKSWFPKGHMPVNYRPVGSERINADGYAEVKVTDPNKWRMKHVITWEAENGPVPKGSVVLFGDGNKLNFDLNNLILVSRKQLAVLNHKGLIQNSAELTRTGIIIADLYSKMSELGKGQRKRSK